MYRMYKHARMYKEAKTIGLQLRIYMQYTHTRPHTRIHTRTRARVHARIHTHADSYIQQQQLVM